jgi:calcineurin-like phosphoesterase family protein
MMNFVNMGNVWITADTHYNHKNICRGVTEWRNPDGSIPIVQTRDFPTVQKMNDIMVNNINSVVMPNDFLVHLGDWSFGGFESIFEFYDRLACKNIYLILGNHDKHILKNRDNIREIFFNVDKEEEDYMFDDHAIHLHHYPITSWKDIKEGRIHLHGHTHLMGDKRFGVGRRMDVGIDGHPEFRPYNLKTEVIPIMLKKPIRYELGGLDHHGDNLENKGR